MPQLSITPNSAITYKLVHEDEHLLIVNKRSGLVTTPGLGHENDSLLNGLFAEWGAKLQNLGAKRGYGLLHRLDKPTSGLVMIALTKNAYDALREAFETRTVGKFYWTIVEGEPKRQEGVVTLPITEYQGRTKFDRTPGEKKKLARISTSGAPARTAYRMLQTGKGASLLECRAVTGRLHQVRVHMEAIGCPILGDEFYSNQHIQAAAPRLALHAHRLVFTHPVSGERIDVRTPWPADLRATLKRVGLARPDLDQNTP
jgi:23S rRNA pseudouridine1911/1915/1917 synthase